MSLPSRTAGILLVSASAVAYSTAGFFTRLIPLDAWTILFWRGVFAGVFIAACFVAMERRRASAIFDIRGPGLVVALCSGLATILFINAFRRTSVADVVILFATAPFMTAAISRVFYGVRESRVTLIASAAALIGVVVMMGGAGTSRHLIGDLLALAVAVLMAIMMVIVRAHRDTPMLPAASLSAFLCAVLVLPVAAPLRVSGNDMVLLFLFGVTQFGLGLLLLTLGTRLVSATESALINTLEVPLAALWVWLAFSEIPAWTTVIGGVIVVAAVVANIAAPRYWNPAATALPSESRS